MRRSPTWLRSDYPADRLRVAHHRRRLHRRHRGAHRGGARGRRADRVDAGAAPELKLEQLRYALESRRRGVGRHHRRRHRARPGLRPRARRAADQRPDHRRRRRTHPSRNELLEERIYWWFLNTLWWLEGEALSAASSPACATRSAARSSSRTPHAAGADDILFALAAGAHGHGVRLCRAAGAVETRVPHSPAEFISFRRRRGAGYLGALVAPLPASGLSGWRLARAVRLFHFIVSPLAMAAVTVSGLGALRDRRTGLGR